MEQIDQTVKGTGALVKLYNIMSEVGWIAKNADVAFGNTKYQYTSETQMLVDLKPLFNKYKLILVPTEINRFAVTERREMKGSGTSQKESVSSLVDLIVTYRFYDIETGDYVQVQMAGQGADNLDKAVYKALTGAYKYVLRESLLIGTGDDPEATTEDGTPTGTSTAITHPAHALQQIFNNANLDIKSNPKILAVLSKHDIIVSDTLEPTLELKKIYGKVSKIASHVQSGKSLEDAIELFNESMRS